MRYVCCCILTTIALCSQCYAQDAGSQVQDMLRARDKLERLLDQKPEQDKRTDSVTVIKDSAMAVLIAEPLLFDIYGREKVLHQRPYKVFLLDGYWCVMGSGPQTSRKKHRPFLMLIDARNGQVLGY